MMVASAIRGAQFSALVFWNKTVYICLLVAIAMIAASPMPGADVSAPAVSAAGTANAGASTTLVVRTDPRTGKLVRRPAQPDRAVSSNVPVNKFSESKFPVSTKPASAPKSLAAPKPEISAMVEQAAKTHEVDPLLVHAVIATESNYDAHAVSPKGAEGLMQLMPPTARMLGVTNSFDPAQNIEAGVRYLKQLQDLYRDDMLALAAYNAGPKAVDKFKSVPPFKETQNYVDRVGRNYEAARAAAVKSAEAAAVTAPAQAAGQALAGTEHAGSGEDRHPKLEQSVDENGRLSLKTSP